ncbi:MAG: Lrp/AsnC family transcriptional regulator, partial [Methylovirgula sp.]
LALTAFVTIEVGDHSRDRLNQFAQTISAMEEVMDVYRMAGDIDYLLRVVVPDTNSFDAFYHRLIEAIPLKSVTSRFALESIKAETALPIRV